MADASHYDVFPHDLPHLPHCFQTNNNKGQVTAWLRQANTVCTPGGKHTHQTNCSTYWQKPRTTSGGGPQRCWSRQGRIYHWRGKNLSIRSPVLWTEVWCGVAVQLQDACHSFLCNLKTHWWRSASLPWGRQYWATLCEVHQRVPGMRKPNIHRSVQFNDAILHWLSLLCFAFF